MTDAALLPDDFLLSLANAVILSSEAPMLLLAADATARAASRSICRPFAIDSQLATLVPLASLGHGEWEMPQLQALLLATASGFGGVEGYEMHLRRPGQPNRCLSLDAYILDYPGVPRAMVLLSITDITDTRERDRQKDGLVREKAVMLLELQHRVANSLQIIASVLLQSARKTQSDEAGLHVNAAHHRVMSVAALQQQLALSQLDDVALKDDVTSLCRSIGASMIRDPSVLSIDVDVDRSVVKPEVSLSLGLIVTELVINSLRHAFPDQRGGRIVVGARAVGDRWTLSVRDDGVGTPEGGLDAKAGLGTSIVRALTAQLGAEIETAAGLPGTLVSVSHAMAVDLRRPRLAAV